MGFSLNVDEILKGLDEYQAQMIMGVTMYAQTCASKLEGEAKDKAPWTDRTHDARSRLTGRVSSFDKAIRITLAHGVTYGKWLELANEKRFAIVAPVILKNTQSILQGLQKLAGGGK